MTSEKNKEGICNGHMASSDLLASIDLSEDLQAKLASLHHEFQELLFKEEARYM